MKNILYYVIDRASERSTWLGFAGLLTALGVGLSPEQIEAIVSIGLAAVGVIAVFTRD